MVDSPTSHHCHGNIVLCSKRQRLWPRKKMKFSTLIGIVISTNFVRFSFSLQNTIVSLVLVVLWYIDYQWGQWFGVRPINWHICDHYDIHISTINHTGKPNSLFSAKHHPFWAQTIRSRHTIPVLGLIHPFTAQSHNFGVFWRVPHMCCLLQDTIAVVGTSQGMARSTKSNHEASPEMTMVYHKD